MDFFKGLTVKYTTGTKENWFGRNSLLKDQYWHQKILTDNISDFKTKKGKEIGLLGYACDAGVQRNLGRIGARKAPKKIRTKLAKLPIHFQENITDFGDITCIEDALEDCQKAFSKSITKLISNNVLPIAIGGGHDIAYANFNGIKEALKNTTKKNIGIINFDAHFDLRPVATKCNSGTPFNQILQENENVRYLAIGIQKQSNTQELFNIAKKHNVSFIPSRDCETFSKALKTNLTTFVNHTDCIYITIDLDGFSSAYAPGVSAPSPFGFSPNFVYNALEFIFKSKKVISCDVAELNPEFDIDNSTANLAARLIDFMVLNA